MHTGFGKYLHGNIKGKSMSAAPQLSILIVNYNAGPLLERCLDSISAHAREILYEICVVDNASADESLQILRSRFPSVKVIANDRNLGFAKALNQGLRATTGRYCLWLNPDAELKEGQLKDLTAYAEAEPQVGILGPQILNADGSIQLSCRSFPSYATAIFNRYSLLTRLFPQNPFSRAYLKTDCSHQSLQEADWVSGACLLHRRSLLDAVGFLDERFFMYCEDVDFCKRAKAAGWKVIYQPTVKILHHIAGSSKHIPQRMVLERHKSMWVYYKKHFQGNPLKDAAVGLAIWVRFFFLSVLQFVKGGGKRRGHA